MKSPFKRRGQVTSQARKVKPPRDRQKLGAQRPPTNVAPADTLGPVDGIDKGIDGVPGLPQ